MITHDRYFLDNVVEWILELDRGKYFPYEGNYSTYLEKKAKRLEQEEREESGRQKAIKDELEWIRQGAKARQTKSKARIAKFDQLVASQEKRKSRQVRDPHPGARAPGRQGHRGRTTSPRPMATNCCSRTCHSRFRRAASSASSGPTARASRPCSSSSPGQEKPDAGEIDIGPTVHLGYVDQSRDHLDDKKNVWEEISDGLDYMKVNGHDQSTRAYVGAFNFKGQDQQKNVGKLSGGERNRVNIAKMLKRGGNVLLLDEPTNDLDVETLGALEEAIENFAGCAVVISHDRFFLDRLATHILAFEGDSRVEWFEGNFAGL